MFGALDLIYIFLLLNVLNEHLVLPWDAGNKSLVRILEDELNWLGAKTIDGKFKGLYLS